MSIYSSAWSVDADDHADTCARWVPYDRATDYGLPPGTWARYDNDDRVYLLHTGQPCTCNAGPLVYRGSHILPAGQDQRGGTLGLAEISGHITREGRDDGPDSDDRPWPYVRVTIRAEGAPDCQDLVLDRGQYTELRDYLTSLIERTEAT